MTLSFIIPAYNEERTLTQLLDKVVAVNFAGDIKKELIIVNDASKDKTFDVAQGFAASHQTDKISIKVLNNPQNMGKSQTVKRGILNSSGKLVVIQDADLEYEPNDLVEFVAMFSADPELDLIYGNRFGKENKVIYWQNYWGNKFLTGMSNLFTWRHGLRVSDMEVCYKMANGDIYRELAEGIKSKSNFGFEPEITAKFAQYRKQDGKRLKFAQIGINYYPRSKAEGKHMKAFRDGAKALGEIVRFNLFRG